MVLIEKYKKEFFGVFAILIFHITATYFYWYFLIPRLDIFSHLVGGFICFSFIARFSDFYNNQITKSKLILSLFIVLIIGFFWEIFEFSLDFIRGMPEIHKIDSLFDLFFDIVGGILFFIAIKINKIDIKNSDK